jgi:hypothetical protein
MPFQHLFVPLHVTKKVASMLDEHIYSLLLVDRL